MSGDRNCLPTRRAVLAAITGWRAVCGAAVAAPDLATVAEPQVGFAMPAGACDAHVHVIADPLETPMSPNRDTTPPAATVDQLSVRLARLGIERVVIVTPDLYDTDNSATLNAIKRLGRDRARGVGWIAPATPSDLLTEMRASGIAGMRVPLFRKEYAAKHLVADIELAARVGWHIEIAPPPEVTAAALSQLVSSPVPVVIDTFGWAQGGVEQPGFDAVVSLVASGRAYVKLSEPYRISKRGPDYPDLAPLVQALLKANPQRLLWGSGWPYLSAPKPGAAKSDVTPNLPIEDGDLLHALAQWVPDAAVRRMILVDNPARLYSF